MPYIEGQWHKLIRSVMHFSTYSHRRNDVHKLICVTN